MLNVVLITLESMIVISVVKSFVPSLHMMLVFCVRRRVLGS